MSRMTAHQQLRRTNSAKGYVAGRCNASTGQLPRTWAPNPTRLSPPVFHGGAVGSMIVKNASRMGAGPRKLGHSYCRAAPQLYRQDYSVNR